MVDGLRPCAEALEGSSASANQIKIRIRMVRVSFPLEPVYELRFTTKT
jgi:hypothetical protein